MMSSKGRLIVISAPSGTGKTSVIKKLLQKNPNMVHSVSWTTRPRRPQEQEGRDYHFVDVAAFQTGIANGEFAEWAKVHHGCYGTPKAALEKHLREGLEVLLDLDVQGAKALKKLFGKQAVTIFLLPPTVDELERRLRERKTDSTVEREIRLKNARQELAHKNDFDFQVVNHDLEQACREIEEILCSA